MAFCRWLESEQLVVWSTVSLVADDGLKFVIGVRWTNLVAMNNHTETKHTGSHAVLPDFDVTAKVRHDYPHYSDSELRSISHKLNLEFEI